MVGEPDLPWTREQKRPPTVISVSSLIMTGAILVLLGWVAGTRYSWDTPNTQWIIIVPWGAAIALFVGLFWKPIVDFWNDWRNHNSDSDF